MAKVEIPPGHFYGHFALSGTDLRRLLSGQIVDLQRDEKIKISIVLGDVSAGDKLAAAMEFSRNAGLESRPRSWRVCEKCFPGPCTC
jgi:hypothetical protein